MYKIIILIGFFLLSLCSLAQISTPEKRKFNVGIYAGLSIWKERPMAAVDFSYKGSTLRIMPNYKYYSLGFTQELAKLSPTFYNLVWTASVYGGLGNELDGFPDPKSNTTSAAGKNSYTKNTTTGILSTGLKTYFAKRMYTHIMGGVMYNKNTGGASHGVKDSSEIIPYFEFGIGMNFFKNYPKLKPEETEE